MRVFAAIPVPLQVAAPVEAALPPLPEGVRAIPRQRWHITLAFYGEVADPDRLGQRLARRIESLRLQPLVLRIAGGGRFGRSLAYLAVTEEGPGGRLDALARACRHAGRTDDGGRTFKAHVTVARARRTAGVPDGYPAALSALSSPPWPVLEAVLYESQLGPVPRYRALRAFPIP